MDTVDYIEALVQPKENYTDASKRTWHPYKVCVFKQQNLSLPTFHQQQFN